MSGHKGVHGERRRWHARNARRGRIVAVAGVWLGALFALAPGAVAADFVVTEPGDLGPGNNLRTVLGQANADPATPDRITFASNITGTITVNSQLPITGPVTISGPGAKVLAISGGDATRVFVVNLVTPGGDVTINGLTITDGYAPGEVGGAIATVDANFSLTNSAVTSSRASSGGGLYVDGEFDLGRSTDVINSTFSGNGAGDGGAIFAENSVGEVVNSTISGNQTDFDAGGVLVGGGAGGAGGFYGTTIANNETGADFGGGIWNISETQTVLLEGSIVAGNRVDGGAAGDLEGAFDAAYSLVGTTAGADVTDTSGGQSLLNVNPALGPLADNGGPTLTHRPATSSPVIDRGGSFSPTDQRGLPRPFDVAAIGNSSEGAADMGSLELQASDFPSATPPKPCKKKKKGKGKKGKRKKRAAPAAKCKKKRKKKKRKKKIS